MEEIEVSIQTFPSYLNNSFFQLFAKKIIVGIGNTFEVKVLILSEKKNLFLEVSKEVYFKFLLLLDELICNIENENGKYHHNLGEHISVKNHKNSKIILSNDFRNVQIPLTKEEIKKILDFRPLFYYTLNKLTMNVSSVQAFYRDYLKVAAEKNLTALSQYELYMPVCRETFCSLDFQRIFFEIPIVFGEHKIQRDIENLSLSNVLNNFVNLN
jgi:hypothetical protein